MDLACSFYADKEHDEDDIEIYAYGLEIFLSSALQLLIFLLFGLLTGQLLATIAFLAAFIPIRTVAGGYHARTHLRCFLGFCTIYAAFLGLLHSLPTQHAGLLSITFVFIAAILVLTLAPLADENKPIGPKQRKKFRRKSLMRFSILAVSAIIFSIMNIIPSIVLAFSIGLFAAACSLAAAKIRDLIKLRRVD